MSRAVERGNMPKLGPTASAALFDGERHTQVQTTLDHISDVFDCHVYIEDSDGRLLYSSEDSSPDTWRKSFAPFSPPSHPRAAELLARWHSRMQIYRNQTVVLAEGDERILLPLAYQGRVFAIVHFVDRSATKTLRQLLDEEIVKMVNDKIYIVVMGSINITRKRYLASETIAELSELLTERDEHRNRIYQAIYLDFGEINPEQFSSSVVDYASIAMRHTKYLAKRLVAFSEDGGARDSNDEPDDSVRTATTGAAPRFFLFHRRGDLLQTVILLVQDSGTRLTPFGSRLAGPLAHSVTVPVGISPIFADINQVGDRIEQAQRILELGRVSDGRKLVFSERDVDFEAFVWQLFSTPQARAYAGAALEPLDGQPELQHTLETYLGNNANVTKTASILVVDRRTVTYRLERIGDLLGRSINSIETRVLLYLALKAKKRI